MIKFAAAAAALFVAAPASAVTVLDFNGARAPNGGTGYVYGPYQEKGFTLTAARCSSPANTCFVTTGTTIRSLDRVGAALMNYLSTSSTTLTAANGGAFRLLGLDVAGMYGYVPSLGVNFTFNFADGTTETRQLSLADTPGQSLTVHSLDFSALAPLSSFSWTPGAGTTGFLQFDNIRLDAVAAGAVPEPASWALMMLGFGAIGGALRTRRRPALTAA